MRYLKIGALMFLIYTLWVNDKNSLFYVWPWVKWILIVFLSIILAFYISIYILAALVVLLLPHERLK